jgi:hypothetical protein
MDNPIRLIEAHQQRVDKMNGELEFPSNGMSIDLLRAVYRNPSIPLPVRMRAAIACLPHETPKLAVMGLVNEQSFAEILDRRLKRMAELEASNGNPHQMIEHTTEQTQPKIIEAKPQVDVRPSLPTTNDRRFRRM